MFTTANYVLMTLYVLFSSDPEAYAQLMLCISDKHEDTPAINAAILAATQDTTTDSIGSFNILQSR